jgi:hypothetical protein
MVNGLIIDATGCSHLWGGDKFYLEDIIAHFKTWLYCVPRSLILLALHGKQIQHEHLLLNRNMLWHCFITCSCIAPG